MKFKRLFQIVVLLTLVFSSFGSGAHVRASSNSPRAALDAIVINRNLNVWDATYLNILIFPIDYNIEYHQSALAMESGSSFSSSFCLYLFNPAFVFSSVDSIESLTSDICNHIQHYI